MIYRPCAFSATAFSYLTVFYVTASEASHPRVR